MTHDRASKPIANALAETRINLRACTRRSASDPFLEALARAALPPWLTPLELKGIMPVSITDTADKSARHSKSYDENGNRDTNVRNGLQGGGRRTSTLTV